VRETNDGDERDPDRHRELREMLGAYAHGRLEPDEQVAVQAHLDGCPSCRAELAELTPLAAELRLVDPDGMRSTPTPSADLGQRIRAQVASEQALRDRRVRRDKRVRWLTAAAAAVALVVGIGVALELREGDRGPAVVAVPQERIDLRAQQPGIDVRSAVLIPHTWGLEVQMTVSGVRAGERYRAVAVDRAGRQLPAGEFLGVADRPVVCNMQAALLRPDATAFLVLDARGRTVAEADLPA